jgi:hypothetical protein
MTDFKTKWKLLTGISVSAVLLGGIFALLPSMIFVSAQTVPPNDMIGLPCIHYDKIVFQIKNNPGGKIPNSLKHTPLDIKVLDDPYKVADLKGKVIHFLSTNPQFEPYGQYLDLTEQELSKLNIQIDDVDYAIDCLEVPFNNHLE